MSPDLRSIIVGLVPRGWSAEQALRAVQLLNQVIAAIWCVHGEGMGKIVLGEGSPSPEEVAKGPRRPVGR